MKRIFSIIMVLLILASTVAVAGAEADNNDITILFTHDLHSHFLTSYSTQYDGVGYDGYGGYARLATAIKQQKKQNPNAILVDGGDFSMGSLFQTTFATSASELRVMGAMGYDATTFGNHEFDYLPQGLAAMLNTAVESGDPLPEIVEANYTPDENNQELQEAMDNYGVKDYTILERNGVYFAVFGINGYDSHDCAPNSGMILEEPAVRAQEVVDEATDYCLDKYGVEPVVVGLSHSGTEDSKGEDYELAQAVNGIDVIVSAHTHTTLEKPIVVNDTYIVSAGEYGKNLGALNLTYASDGSLKLRDYELIPIIDPVENQVDSNEFKEDKKIAKMIDEFKAVVDKDYLSDYGVSFDDILIKNGNGFENTLTNLITDSYKWAVEEATGEKVDVALTAKGVIRDSFPQNDITVSNVFNCVSLGVGTEGELVAVYITGKDLKNALEVDASIKPMMPTAELYFSGVEYSYNTNRMIFNKVDYAMLRTNEAPWEYYQQDSYESNGDTIGHFQGDLVKIDDEKLYKVVTGMYCGQMLGAVEKNSLGLLKITPRDKDGNPIKSEDLVNYVVQTQNGKPLKEWYAVVSYMQTMESEIPERYLSTDTRSLEYSSLNPVKLLSNANKFTYIAMAVIALVILIIMLVVRISIKKS